MRHFVWVALAVLFFAGCGSNLPERVTVRGRVTLDGGNWPNSGMLFFASKQPAKGYPMRPAQAEMATDGTFQVTSFGDGDGLVPGKYVVKIECWKVPPTMARPNVPSAVPKKYQDPATSDFFVEIQPGQSSVDIEFDVRSDG